MLSFSCAKVGSPTGGPKDTKAPYIKDALPANGSTNFTENSFYIKFDEYVKLNNIQQNLIVSPPFSEKPKVKIKGKGVLVSFPEDLKENTTYSFTFLNAISDITENNEIPSLVYALSTGDEIDSLKVAGKILDAYSGDVVKDAYVMLYRNLEDSAFRTQIPEYMTVSNAQGEFEFQYVAEGEYALYALEDANYSYTFDQPNERIAFLDSVIVPSAEKIFIVEDSLFADVYYPVGLQMRMFEEPQVNQYITENSRPDNGKISLVFARKNSEKPKWNSPDISSDDVIEQWSTNQDSLTLYLRNAEIAQKDSIQIVFQYESNVDTIGMMNDTLVFPLGDTVSNVNLASNLLKGKLHYFHSFELSTDALLQTVNSENIQLYHQKNDSTEVSKEFEIIKQDSLNKVQIVAKLKEGELYRVVVDSAAITDVLNRVNDSLSFAFEYRKLGSYSSLKLNITADDNRFFCELLQGDKTIKKAFPDESGNVVFHYLEPGSYRVRMVKDINENKVWDSGILKTSQQPEYVLYYSGSIELRANWDQETDWILED